MSQPAPALPIVRNKEQFYALRRKLMDGGDLPEGFQDWLCSDGVDTTIAHVAARYGKLPANFDQWHIVDYYGQTVAHEAAIWGTLPIDFDQWGLVDSKGETVAHMATNLPADFDKWGLVNARGHTVAHTAAMFGTLPLNFRQWGLTNNKGHTVAEIFLWNIYHNKLNPALHESAQAWLDAHKADADDDGPRP